MRIALIHALAHSVAPINIAFARDWPEAQRMNLLDDSLSADLAAGGRGLDAAMHERFMRLGGTLINMLHYVKPGLKQAHSVLKDAAGQGPGLSHLVIRVDAIDPVLDRAAAHGGSVITGTRSLLHHPALPGETVDIAQIHDPEGTRIELIQNADVVMEWMRTPRGRWQP